MKLLMLLFLLWIGLSAIGWYRKTPAGFRLLAVVAVYMYAGWLLAVVIVHQVQMARACWPECLHVARRRI